MSITPLQTNTGVVATAQCRVQEALQLPCAAGHTFHDDCVRSWLSRNVTCPLCRVDEPWQQATTTIINSPLLFLLDSYIGMWMASFVVPWNQKPMANGKRCTDWLWRSATWCVPNDVRRQQLMHWAIHPRHVPRVHLAHGSVWKTLGDCMEWSGCLPKNEHIPSA